MEKAQSAVVSATSASSAMKLRAIRATESSTPVDWTIRRAWSGFTYTSRCFIADAAPMTAEKAAD
jgi:hypothetical protein